MLVGIWLGIRLGVGHVQILPLNQLFRLYYIIKHKMGLHNFPSGKLQQSQKVVPPSATRAFENIDVIAKRYPLHLEQKVDLQLAHTHMHRFSATGSARCHSTELLRKFCAKREPNLEGLNLFDDADLSVDPFAPTLNLEVEEIPLAQKSQPRHPPMDG